MPLKPAIEGDYLIVLSAKNEQTLRQQAAHLHTYLAAHTDTNLAVLVATLLAGRAAMVHRLAVLVSSVEQLQDLLVAFAERTESQLTTAYYLGQNDSEEESVDIAHYVLDSDINTTQLQTLAQQWVKGEVRIQVDGADLQGNWRLSLPGYPFERETYWVQTFEQPMRSASQAVAASATEQLLISSSHAWFQDHQVKEHLLLPGVAMLALSWQQLYGAQTRPYCKTSSGCSR